MSFYVVFRDYERMTSAWHTKHSNAWNLTEQKKKKNPRNIFPPDDTEAQLDGDERVNTEATVNSITVKDKTHSKKDSFDTSINFVSQSTYVWTKTGHTGCSTTCGTGKSPHGFVPVVHFPFSPVNLLFPKCTWGTPSAPIKEKGSCVSAYKSGQTLTCWVCHCRDACCILGVCRQWLPDDCSSWLLWPFQWTNKPGGLQRISLSSLVSKMQPHSLTRFLHTLQFPLDWILKERWMWTTTLKKNQASQWKNDVCIKKK